MRLSVLTKLPLSVLYRKIIRTQIKKCHSVFGIKDLIQPEKLDTYTVTPVTSEHHDLALDIVKKFYLPEHVLVRARNMDISNDRALDEYLISLLKQGNSLFVNTESGNVAGVCVNCASSPEEPKNMRNFAFYRQDPNTKDFLYFTAKLLETPNLWEVFNEEKIFEIKMLTVLPEYRRHGLAVMMAEKSKEIAQDQGYNVLRMDCINPYDFKVAERCMLQCIVKFPLHKLRGATAPYIRRSSEHNKCVRVYVDAHAQPLADRDLVKNKQTEIESLIE